MTSTLTPYVQFPERCREALEFYASVLGGTPQIMTFGDMDPTAGEHADKVMHAFLRTDDGYELMASDSAPGMPVDHGASIAMSLSGDDERLREHFAGLSEGGQVEVPLETQMWGDEFGMFTDRFGVRWMVNLGGPSDQVG